MPLWHWILYVPAVPCTCFMDFNQPNKRDGNRWLERQHCGVPRNRAPELPQGLSGPLLRVTPFKESLERVVLCSFGHI